MSASDDEERETRDRRLRISKDITDAVMTTRPLDGRAILADLAWLLRVTEPPALGVMAETWATGYAAEPVDPRSLPRVWRGESVNAKHWWWMRSEGKWGDAAGGDGVYERLSDREIFVPSCFPRPTESVDVEPLTKCREIDWADLLEREA